MKYWTIAFFMTCPPLSPLHSLHYTISARMCGFISEYAGVFRLYIELINL